MDVELTVAKSKMKNTKPKVQRCLRCEHRIRGDLGRKHTVDCRQTVHPTRVAESLWTVPIIADGNSLTGADVDTARADAKRTRPSLKHTSKIRKDPDDTVGNCEAKRLRHTVKRSLSSSLAIPHQVEKTHVKRFAKWKTPRDCWRE